MSGDLRFLRIAVEKKGLLLTFPRFCNSLWIRVLNYGIAMKLKTSAKMAQVSMIPSTIR